MFTSTTFSLHLSPPGTPTRRMLALVALALLILVALAIVPTTATATGNASPVASGDWFLLLDEQFNSPQLDTQIWHTCYFWADNGCTNQGNAELQWYQTDDVLLQNGLLRLRAQRRTVNGYNYTSGMISSDRGFYYQYGYLEARVRIPRGKALWPAVWLLPSPETGWPPEIDVMEALGDDTTEAAFTVHYIDPTQPGSHGRQQGHIRGIDFAADFHVFGLDWQPDRLTWYVDNVEQFTVTTHVPTNPMYVLVNLAIGGTWVGAPDETTPFPAYYDVDYVRVWQRPEHFLSSQG